MGCECVFQVILAYKSIVLCKCSGKVLIGYLAVLATKGQYKALSGGYLSLLLGVITVGYLPSVKFVEGSLTFDGVIFV